MVITYYLITRVSVQYAFAAVAENTELLSALEKARKEIRVSEGVDEEDSL